MFVSLHKPVNKNQLPKFFLLLFSLLLLPRFEDTRGQDVFLFMESRQEQNFMEIGKTHV